MLAEQIFGGSDIWRHFKMKLFWHIASNDGGDAAKGERGWLEGIR